MAEALRYPFQNVQTRRAVSPGDRRSVSRSTTDAERRSGRRQYSPLNTPSRTKPSTDEIFRNQQVNYSSVERSRDTRLAQRDKPADRLRPTTRASQVATRALGPQPLAVSGSFGSAVATAAGTVRRGSVLLPTIVPGLYAHAALVFFWVLSMAGIGLSVVAGSTVGWIPLIGERLAEVVSFPGEALMLAGWGIASIIGCLTLLVVAGVCLIRGIVIFTNANTMLLFIGAFTLYLFPFTQWFPWYLAFAAGVTLFHR